MTTAQLLPQPIALLADIARVRRAIQRVRRLPGLPFLAIGRRVRGRGGARSYAPELPWEAERMAMFAPGRDPVPPAGPLPPFAAMPPGPMRGADRSASAPAAARPASPAGLAPAQPPMTHPDRASAPRSHSEVHRPAPTSSGPAAGRRLDPLSAGLAQVLPGWVLVAPRLAGRQLAGATPAAPRGGTLPRARPPAPSLPFAGLRWRPVVRQPRPGAQTAPLPSPAGPAQPAAGTGRVMPPQAAPRFETPPGPSPALAPRAMPPEGTRPDAEHQVLLPWPTRAPPAWRAGPPRTDLERLAPLPWPAPALAPQTPPSDPAAAPLLVQRGQQAVPASLATVIVMGDSLQSNVRKELDEVRAMVARIAERPAPPAPKQAVVDDGERARQLLGRMRVLMQEEQFRRGHIR